MVDIILTALATLVVTIISGLVINYFSHKKAKIVYSIIESNPMSKEEGDKNIAINLVEVFSASNTTIENTTIIIKTSIAKIIRFEISTTNACKVSTTNSLDKEIELFVPLLAKDDKISISMLVESYLIKNGNIEVFFRNPKNLKTTNLSNKNTAKKGYFGQILSIAITASTIVGLSLTITNTSILPFSNKKDNMIFLASISNIPDLAKYLSITDNIAYYNLGDIIYSLATQTNDIKLIDKYCSFLSSVSIYTNEIAKTSRAVIYYSISKIFKLKNDSKQVENNLQQALKLDKNEIRRRIKIDSEYSSYLEKSNIKM